MTLQMKYDQEREEGLELLAKLIQFLLKDGRNEDVKRVAEDSEYRKELMSEYGLYW